MNSINNNSGVHGQAASGHVYESVLEYSDGYKHILVMMLATRSRTFSAFDTLFLEWLPFCVECFV